MHRLRPVALLFAIACVSGGESAPAPASAAELKPRLPDLPTLVVRNDQLFWQAPDAAEGFAVVDVAGDAPVVATAIGPLKVARKALAAGDSAVRALPALIAQAQAAQVPAAEVELVSTVLTGVHLRGKEVLVLDQGVLRRQSAGAERKAEVEAIAAARDALLPALERTKLDESGRAAVRQSLSRIADTRAEDDQRPGDELRGAFLRRVVRHGWLRQVCGDLPEAAALAQAVAVAERPQPKQGFASADGTLRVAEMVDAFGDGGWVLMTPKRTAFSRLAAKPEYHFRWSNVNLRLVVELTPGSDALSEQPEAIAAAVYQDDTRLAAWTRGAGADDTFAADAEAWRVAVQDAAAADADTATGFMPPHVMVVDLDGDPLLMGTAGGTVPALRDGTVASGERFLAAATRALKDAGALDLVGEYFLTYVYDSPDSRFPFLIGHKDNKGDIHQTVAQTLATAAGGQFRGDCDDLAELYETIADRQGRTAHVVALPAHAAAAWAEQAEGQWSVFVLQTGRPEQHRAATLPEALKKAYLSFDAGDTFDANGLGLLLRFDDENTRSSWRLSWRIFSEPDYAATMIDVQHDWHLQTYQRGIDKMLRLIAVGRMPGDAAQVEAAGRALVPKILAAKDVAEVLAATPQGDHDNANFRELSGLYSFTGQYDLAARFHRWAIERTDGRVSQALLRAELIGHLFNAGQKDVARGEAEQLVRRGIDAVAKELGEGKRQFGQELAGVLAHNGAPDLAIAVLEKTTFDSMPGLIEQVAGWVKSNRFDRRRWEGSAEMASLRRAMLMFVITGTAVLKESGPDALASDQHLQKLAGACQHWFNDIAMRDADDDGEIMQRYAWAGAFYGAVLGDELFDGLLLSAKPAEARRDNHLARSGGLAQLRLDLPWINAAVPYWWARMEELIAREEKTLDPARIALLAKRVEKAAAALAQMRLSSPRIEADLHLARTLAALVAQDEAQLRARLRFVKDKGDKRLRDDTAQVLGDVARFLPMPWWQTVNRCWKDELDYGPKWFWIAWRAALNGGPKHALATAEAAYASKKNDQFLAEPFKEELEFMRGLFGK